MNEYKCDTELCRACKSYIEKAFDEATGRVDLFNSTTEDSTDADKLLCFKNRKMPNFMVNFIE